MAKSSAKFPELFWRVVRAAYIFLVSGKIKKVLLDVDEIKKKNSFRLQLIPW